jgi:hypothetical protein
MLPLKDRFSSKLFPVCRLQSSAAVVAMPVRGILMMTVGSTIGPMTPARTFAYCQPTFRGKPRKVGFHAGRGSRHVGNEVSTQTHCIRGACLPFRIGALGACTVRPTSKSTGKQCKRASQLENTHVVTSALRVILRTVTLPCIPRPDLGMESHPNGA